MSQTSVYPLLRNAVVEYVLWDENVTQQPIWTQIELSGFDQVSSMKFLVPAKLCQLSVHLY
jgi:hypothetical protein